MNAKSKLIDLLGVRYPIIQAPMAGSDNAQMVAAASNAGALGSLGAQYRTPGEIRDTIRQIRSLTDKPFAVNLFALPDIPVPSVEEIEEALVPLKPYYEQFGISLPTPESVQRTIDANAQLEVILEEGVPVFSYTLGLLDAAWTKRFKQAGTVVIGTATNVQEAVALQQSGVDAIVVQGAEAGGHRGTFIGDYRNSMIGLFSLLPQLVEAVDVPIVAAGGIMDGRGIAAALVLGAQAVQMGTAFLTTAECPVHANYKQSIRSHQAADTAITKVFSGGAARGISNQFMRDNANAKLLPFPYHNALTRPIRKAANERGEMNFTNLWCGQSGQLAREMSTSELVQILVRETNEALSGKEI